MDVKEIKVYKIINNKKGIISANFYNPRIDKKTTKSLGKNIGLDENEADKIIEEISKLINDSSYFNDIDGYTRAQSDFSKRVVDMVFSEKDVVIHEKLEQQKRYIEEKMPFEAPDSTMVLLIGESGSGKTTMIQQMLGSKKYNTPITTTSNTTVSPFQAVIDKDVTEPEMIISCLSEEEILESLGHNIRSCLFLALEMEENTDSSTNLTEKLLPNLLTSENAKLRLSFLVKKSNYKKDLEDLIKEVITLSKKQWHAFSEKKQIKAKYKELMDDQKDEFINFIEENEEEIEEVATFFWNEIVKPSVKSVWKEIFRYLSDHLSADDYSIEFFINSTKYTEAKSFDQLSDDIIEMFSLRLKNKDNDKEDFWNIFRLFSCGDEEVSNLYPLVRSSRVRGDFKPSWLESVNSAGGIDKATIIDSEGFSHDLQQYVFNPETISFMQKSHYVFWAINASKAMSETDVSILNVLRDNGCLNKLKLCFNRLDRFDKLSEKSNEAKDDRITLLINNLFRLKNNESKSFNLNRYKNDLLMQDKRLYFDYLEYDINDGYILDSDAHRAVAMLPDELKKELSKKLSKKVEFTIESFNRIIKMINEYSEVAKTELKAPQITFKAKYSQSILARYMDLKVEELYSYFCRQIDLAHWNTVKAFTFRVIKKWDHYSWSDIKPVLILQKNVKTICVHFLESPVNLDDLNENENALFLSIIQSVQEEIAPKIDKKIIEIIVDNEKSAWSEAYSKWGGGSGKERKNLVNEIYKRTLFLGDNKEIVNNIYIELIEILKNNETLRKIAELNN